MSQYPLNLFDDSVPDVPTSDVLAEIARYEHRLAYHFNVGHDDEPLWKAICECGWECWNQPDRTSALASHREHVGEAAA